MSNDSDPFGGDPYRGSVYREVSAGQCPRCDGPLMEGWRSLTCPRNCGELVPRTMLPGELSIEQLAACEPDVGSLIGRPFPPARCPLCRRKMEVRVHGGVVFDFCFDHGPWLDRGERAAFERAFIPAAERDAVFVAAREAAARPGRPVSRWRTVVLRALMLDETPPLDAAPLPDATEREEQAWLDEERERLDGKRG
jgi:Zn-finger nucleic acid-binding protein